MTKTTTTLALAGAILAITGCHRSSDVGTTTVRSGSPSGVRVTNGAGAADADAAARRLAGAICAHERRCGEARGDRPKEAVLLQEESCVAELTTTTAISVAALPCAPAEARGLDACVAALRAEPCDRRAGFPQPLAACRAPEVCGR